MKMRFIYIGLAILMLLATACQAQPPVSATPVAPLSRCRNSVRSANGDAFAYARTAYAGAKRYAFAAAAVTPTPKPTKAPTPKPGALTMKMAQAVYAPDSEQLKATMKNDRRIPILSGKPPICSKKQAADGKRCRFQKMSPGSILPTC
jgi:hypothetical protein